MKRIGSLTTTIPKDQRSKAGMQRGERGLETQGSLHDLPAPTPQLSQSLPPQKLEENRTKIVFDVEVILSGYWKEFPAKEMKAAILADWADTLEDWEPQQVLWGLRKWRNENPSRRPNPGHILGILKEARGKAETGKMGELEIAERNIKSGKRFLCTNIGTSVVSELLRTNRVTKEECREVGL